MGIAELAHMCLVRKKGGKNPTRKKNQNTHKPPHFCLKSPNHFRDPSHFRWLIKQTTHFCLSTRIIMFEISGVLCIRLKLYAASEALNFDRTMLGKLTRKHSTEKILK